MIDLTAYDTAGNEINEWLDEPIGIWGISATGVFVFVTKCVANLVFRLCTDRDGKVGPDRCHIGINNYKEKTMLRIMQVSVVMLATAMVASLAIADPLDREVPKFLQMPMIETVIGDQAYYGHDEESTVYNTNITTDPDQPLQYPLIYKGNYVADDFADESSMPAVHVQWWGSYLNNSYLDINFPIKKFLITFEKDVAADDPSNEYGYSHPGEPILSQVVTLGDLAPGSGTFTETLIHPGGSPLNEALFAYNAELACPFEQEPNTVYWLKIAAMVDIEDFDGNGQVDLADLSHAPRWGWHNRDYTKPNPLASTAPLVNPGEKVVGTLEDGTEIWHFQDDAVANGPESGVEVIVHTPDAPCEVDVNQLLSQFPPNIPDFVPQSYWPGYDGPDEIGDYSKDLAFALYSSVPEPSTIVLLALGVTCLLAKRRRPDA